MADKFAQLHDKNNNKLLILGSDVKKADGSTNWSEEGAQVNVIEGVKVNGTSQTITNKVVDIIIPSASSYTMVQVATPASQYSAQYYLSKDGVQVGATINIAKDMVVSSGSVVTITFDSTTNKLYDGQDDVTEIIKGPGVTPTAADAGTYIKLIIANSTNDRLYIAASGLVSNYTAGNAITISSNSISVNYGNGLTLSSGALIVNAGTGINVDSNGVSVKLGTGLETDSSNNVKVKLNATSPGLEADSNGLKVKINATNPGLVLDGNGIAVKVKSSNSGLTLDSNGLYVNVDSSSDLTIGSNGMKLAGESNTSAVVYFTEITVS